MFDFGSLVKNSSAEVPATLSELFKQLDRKTTHTSLRPAQIAAMTNLDAHLSQRDIIMKLSTGSGKTVVGLVYAEMMRLKYKGEPVVYLCPTNQLLEQVVISGQAIGVSVSTFKKSELPYSAMSGETILACTYDRLFTANSVFENQSIRPSAIIMDDVHSGSDRVRKFFTAQVPPSCAKRLINLFRPLCEQTDSATWARINQSDPNSKYEVPYWVWSQVSGEVAQLLDAEKDVKPLVFTWDNIARYIELARCCISGDRVEIALQVPPVEDVPAYAGAKHRLFMSASIKDISSLISILDCDPAAYTRLIEPMEDEGAGERMILPTSLIKPESKKQDCAEACASLAEHTNVVVLTSSAAQATAWVNTGATLAQDKEVATALEKLRTTQGNYFVFAQRFDGVDLPDDACRILVIDGIPIGDRIIDQVDAYRQKDSPEYEVRTVNKFEQALGRAVRSSADYAAVLLVGTDIAAFIGRKNILSLLENRTRLQIELGRELASKVGQDEKTISVIISEMTQALLSRNESWKEAHRTRVKVKDKRPRPATLTSHEAAAHALRDGWSNAKAKNFQEAISRIREASNGDLHQIEQAELMYWIATYMNQFDPAKASEVYKTVFSKNTKFPRPEQVADRKFIRLKDQAIQVYQIFSIYTNANAALARVKEVRTKLSFGNVAEVVEQGLHELGELLGATSSRPEKETGRGPDVLWLFDDCGACIEAKSEKKAKINKSDAAQLVLSTTWCEEFTVGVSNPVPVFATNVTIADRPEDIAFGPQLMNETTLMKLLDRLQNVILSLTYDGSLFSDAAFIAQKLSENDLNGASIIKKLPVMK